MEANESIGEKDFKMEIKTCCRQAKESSYWLRLVITGDSEPEERAALRPGVKERVLIFTAILRNRDNE